VVWEGGERKLTPYPIGRRAWARVPAPASRAISPPASVREPGPGATAPRRRKSCRGANWLRLHRQALSMAIGFVVPGKASSVTRSSMAACRICRQKEGVSPTTRRNERVKCD